MFYCSPVNIDMVENVLIEKISNILNHCFLHDFGAFCKYKCCNNVINLAY